MSQIEIAHELQVSKQLISAGVQHIRQQAKESIKEYVTEHLPEQYQICLCALDIILKHAYEILQTTHDNREKLQAMQMYRDTHQLKLEQPSTVRWSTSEASSSSNHINSNKSNPNNMNRDPIMTYIRIVEDLERIAATIPRERLDPRLWYEIKELKQELSKQGYVYIDGYEHPFRLVSER